MTGISVEVFNASNHLPIGYTIADGSISKGIEFTDFDPASPTALDFTVTSP